METGQMPYFIMEVKKQYILIALEVAITKQRYHAISGKFIVSDWHCVLIILDSSNLR